MMVGSGYTLYQYTWLGGMYPYSAAFGIPSNGAALWSADGTFFGRSPTITGSSNIDKKMEFEMQIDKAIVNRGQMNGHYECRGNDMYSLLMAVPVSFA